jgi:branched-chain amino acid transport system permease protein
MGRWILTRLLVFAVVVSVLMGINRILVDNIKDYYITVLIQCGIYATLAVSLNLVNGITGQFSIGHAGFYGVGAYMGAAWTMLLSPKLLPFLKLGGSVNDGIAMVLAMLVGAVVAGLAGLLVGLPSLRLRGDYLAIVTLGFGEVIRIVILNLDVVGGPRGFSPIRSLVVNHGIPLVWVYGLLIVVILFSRNLLKSVRGLTWLAVREDEIAADAMGVDTTKTKVMAFVIASAFAGAAGALISHFQTGITPDMFDMNTSIIVTTMVVMGGTGSISGSVVAAVVLTALPELLRDTIPMLKEYRMVIFSTLLVVIMLTRPEGIFGHRELSFARFFKRRRLKGESKA